MSTTPPLPAEGFVTAKAIAGLYDVQPATVYNWAKTKKIPSLKFEDTVRFDVAVVRAAIEHGIFPLGFILKRSAEAAGFGRLCGLSGIFESTENHLAGRVLGVVLGIFNQESVSLQSSPPTHWRGNLKKAIPSTVG